MLQLGSPHLTSIHSFLDASLYSRDEKAKNYISHIPFQLELSMWPGSSQADAPRQDSRDESEGWGEDSAERTDNCGKGFHSAVQLW